MPFAIYAAPWFSEVAVRYIEAALTLPGVRLGVISPDPLDHLPAPLQRRLAGHWRVNDMTDSEQVTHAARALSQQSGPIHCLFSHQEQLLVALARTRERLGIPGMGVEAALNFRDKARMKRLLREAGIPCAHYQLAHSAAEAWDFAREVGFPLVVKPVAGAASQATFRVDEPPALDQALAATGPTADHPILVEEFIVGDEQSFDTYTREGEPVWHSLTHYYPSPLTVMETPWIQWTVVLPREVDHPRYDDIRAAAFQTLQVLGMGTGLSHLEWFRRRDGTIAVSEVAARPPGAQFTTLISAAHDFDALLAWVRLTVTGEFDPPERRYSAGAAYLRPQGRGRIKAIHGLDEAQRELGPIVVTARLPQVGHYTTGHYEGEGFVIVRHPETTVVEQALLRLITLIQIELE